MKRKKRHRSLKEKYPPSEPCSCEICRSYCVRPGWWTVEEASQAIKAGYCHHLRIGLGQKCHADIEKDWRTPAGQTIMLP